MTNILVSFYMTYTTFYTLYYLIVQILHITSGQGITSSSITDRNFITRMILKHMY